VPVPERDRPCPASRPRRPGAHPAVRRTLRLAWLGAVALAAGGCLGQTGGGTVPAGAQLVQIHQMAFRPRIVTVRVGQPVTWRFEDAQVEHDVDSTTGAFRSPVKDSGTWTHVFSTPGTYSYFCSIHTYMTGQVIVVAAPTSSSGQT
jgi:plastocyanin